MTEFTSIHKGAAIKDLRVPGGTIPEIFLKHAAKFGATRAALRHKKDGSWNEYSWRDYLSKVEKVAGGLKALGVNPQDKVCIISANCPEWFFIALAIQSLGAYQVPIYPNATPDQAKYVAEHSEAKIVFVQDQEQLAKTDSWRNDLQNLNRTILMFGEPPDGVEKFEEFLDQGSKYCDQNPNFLKDQIGKLTPDSPGGIIYTSGTTGPPKGVVLTQKNFVYLIAGLLTVYDYVYESETISFLPLSHIAEQVQNITGGIASGSTVNFARSIDTLMEDLAEVRPTLFFSVPRLYERARTAILENVADGSAVKRFLFNWALKVGEKARKHRNSNQDLPFMTKKKWNLASKVVFSKIKTRMGLDRARFMGSGAAPLSVAVCRFFGAMGMDIIELFGQTECTGVCNATIPGKTVPGAVGAPLPGCEVAIAEDGEIVTRGDNVFSGYFKDEAATNEAIKDGWLYTGDIGHFDEDGYLIITDRKKDIIITAGGKNVTPQNIEVLLKDYSGISQACIVGDRRKHLTCLFTLDANSLPRLCEQLGLGTLSMEEAAQNETIIATVQKYVDEVNASLARYETIKYFRILPHDFTIETGELTPTQKMKRRVVQQKYDHIIDSMYD
ncbi:MAG: long-chain fatty acid--CoA ligase [Candidatus Aminicenantes bacterium]|nr:MAG: long-chain fatty acid--CoA ligase [Candidatus Aminicenantes bacterium]